jgi:hypothetical protein
MVLFFLLPLDYSRLAGIREEAKNPAGKAIRLIQDPL